MSEFFPHDYHASSDHKLALLMHRYGVAAYGLWWLLVEEMYSSCVPLSSDVCSLVVRRSKLRKGMQMIEYMVELGLLILTPTGITSKRVIAELSERAERSKSASSSAKKRWDRHANALQPQSEPNAKQDITIQDITVQDSGALASQPKSEVEQRALATIAQRIPTYEQFCAYTETRGVSRTLADRYWNWMEGIGWKVGTAQHPVAKWQSHLETWIAEERAGRHKGRGP